MSSYLYIWLQDNSKPTGTAKETHPERIPNKINKKKTT